MTYDKEYMKKWYELHHNYKKQQRLKQLEKNPNYYKEVWTQTKNDPIKHKKKIESDRKWREENRETINTKARLDRNSNPDKYKDYKKNWLQTHLHDEDFRKRQRNDSRNRNKALKIKILDLLGHECNNCHITGDYRILQIDHLKGNGVKERKQLKACQFYRFYLKNKDSAKERLQILCVNCNQIKRHINNEYRKPSILKISQNNNERFRMLRLQLFNIIGMNCIRCGYSKIEALQLDHINSDGREDRNRFSATKFLKYYISNPQEARNKLQTLCANCNYLKRYENKEFVKPKYSKLTKRNHSPHQRIAEWAVNA